MHHILKTADWHQREHVQLKCNHRSNMLQISLRLSCVYNRLPTPYLKKMQIIQDQICIKLSILGMYYEKYVCSKIHRSWKMHYGKHVVALHQYFHILRKMCEMCRIAVSKFQITQDYAVPFRVEVMTAKAIIRLCRIK